MNKRVLYGAVIAAVLGIAGWQTAGLLPSAITGMITAGSNITLSGSGTLASPYSIAATGGGSYPAAVVHTASGATEVDDTTCFNGTNRDYQIRLSEVTITGSGVTFGLQFSTDGGATYDTASNYYMGRYYVGIKNGDTAGSNANASAATMINLTGLGATDTVSTGYHANGTLTLYFPGGTQAIKTLTAVGTTSPSNTATNSDLVSAGASYANSTAINAFRIKSTGTFSGVITCQPLP